MRSVQLWVFRNRYWIPVPFILGIVLFNLPTEPEESLLDLFDAFGLVLIGCGLLLRAWAVGHAGSHTRSYKFRAPRLVTAEEVTHQAPGVREVAEVRARWSGHRLHLEVNVAVDPALSVAEGHGIAKEVRHQILHHVPHVSQVTVHVDPVSEVGERFHRVETHAHDGLPFHSHS